MLRAAVAKAQAKISTKGVERMYFRTVFILPLKDAARAQVNAGGEVPKGQYSFYEPGAQQLCKRTKQKKEK